MRRPVLLAVLLGAACASRPPAEPPVAADLSAFPDIVFPAAPWRLAPAPASARVAMGHVRVLEAHFEGGPSADLLAQAQAQAAGGWTVLGRQPDAIRLGKDHEVLRIAAGPGLVYTLETRP